MSATELLLIPLLVCLSSVVCVRVLSYGRHSDSLDVSRMACSRCSGELVSLGRFNADGTPAKARAATAFALFVQAQYSATKQRNPTTPHKDIMKLLSSGYKSSKKGGIEVEEAEAAASSSAGHGTSAPLLSHSLLGGSVSAAQAELEAQMSAFSFEE